MGGYSGGMRKKERRFFTFTRRPDAVDFEDSACIKKKGEPVLPRNTGREKVASGHDDA